jgi:uncharacterized protein YbjT (DUF2867 family)
MMTQKNILLTGATGYIGSHLLPILEKGCYNVRCFVRDPSHCPISINSQTQIVKGDLLDKESIRHAMQGIDVAFYLVHSMQFLDNFTEQERRAAIHFAEAASACRVKRIIYLGGLGNSQQHLSSHLKSRQEVGLYLRKYAIGVQVIEFRASIIIGAGSLSFELIRSLCERLPVMITPKWIWNLAQPIAISDVLAYLYKAIEADVGGNPIFEIGGKDQMSYGDIMHEYCRQRDLKRWFISVPVLTPWLSSLWLSLVTPIYARVGRKLIESIRVPTVVQNSAAEEIFQVHPMGAKEAIELALPKKEQGKSMFSED